SGPLGMIGGQVLDIDSEGRQLDTAGLMQIHRLKTGALICCACRMGAIVAGASDAALDAVTAYGEHLGLAFQIADDVLDVTASTEDLGKTAGKDVVAGKNTYPALLGLEEAKRLAQEEADAAIGAVASLGEAADGLRALARFTVERGR
ncbi:MAG: polyprenyl synthetase family protein, partial [Planctomycetota bacterium]